MGKNTNASPTYPQFPGDAMPVVLGVPLPAYGVIYCGVGGSVTLETAQGTVVTFVGVPAGSIIPVQTRLVTAGPASMIAIY